jgi:hypothetical protein
MATTNNITTTYIGKDSKQFISPILSAGKTLGTPAVTIKQNVNYRSRITKIALTDLIKDATCEFDASGTIDQTELWLAVKELEVNMSLCKSDYFNDFIGEDMGPSGDLPSAFLSYLLGEIGGNVADAVETMLWQGTDVSDSFEGFETRFAADVTVVDVTTPIAITASNVISEIRRGTALANPNVLQASDTLIYMGSGVFQSLKEANNDKGNASPCGEDCIAIDGVTVFYAPGMQAGSYAIAQKSNLFFGTCNTNGSIATKDMSDVDLSDTIRLSMKWFAGTQVGYGAEVVYYASV